jgi:hypothetical protein
VGRTGRDKENIMSNHLTGYFLYYPKVMTKTEKEIIQNRIDELEKILKHPVLEKEYEEKDLTDEEIEIRDQLEEDLIKLGVEEWEEAMPYQNSLGYFAHDVLLPGLEEVRNLLKEGRVNGEMMESLVSIPHTRQLKKDLDLPKREIVVLCYAEWSCGDTPETESYERLAAFVHLGIFQLLYDICFGKD